MPYTKGNKISDRQLSECDREKLHHIGYIQSNCGHLIFVDAAGKILAHDADIHKLSWFHSSEAILGTPWKDCVPDDLYESLTTIVDNMKKDASQRAFHFYRRESDTFAISVTTTEPDCSIIGLEIEQVDPNESTESSFSTLSHLSRIVESYPLEAIVNTACETVFSLLQHYDRGMVYRFNDDQSGEVIHEIKREYIQSSYVGMRFPSSDIPLPARKLYIQNGMRYIHNVDSLNVRVISSSQMNLSQIRMRSCALPHVLYLRNMGVVSSLSLAIVVENELWGLFAFHGYTRPHQPSLHRRIACEAITAMVSVRTEALLKKAESTRIVSLSEGMMNFKQDQSVIHNIYDWGDDMLSILDADVLVGNIQDPREEESDRIVLGDKNLVPSEAFWSKVSSHPNRELLVIATRAGINALGLTEQECPSSGIVYFREGRTQILLGRAMRSKDVNWAGNPDEPKLKIGGILNPRSSFESFMEKARKESRAWTTQDINVISVLRDQICEHSHKYMMGILRNDIEDTNEKYLAAIDKARDNYEFFAHMSHELRTPFHGIMGCLDILDENVDTMSPDEIRELVQTAISSRNHMINLLNDILDISKNKYLAHVAAKNKVIYQSLAYETVNCLKSLAASRNITLNCSITPKDEKIVIKTDRTKIIQIVSNIVNNAIKFTGEGSVDVTFCLYESVQGVLNEWRTVSNEYEGVVFAIEDEMFKDVDSALVRAESIPELATQRWILVGVVDTGCGMKADELADMFAPYTQSSSGSNREFQGTGLGLFICLSLVQQLCGFMACASTPGKGTAFSICIPVDLEAESDSFEADDQLNSPELGRRESIPMDGPILLADDNKVNVKILHRALQMELKKASLSVDLITVDGGNAAIQQYKERHPSLCVIDYHMPETDGIAATMAIREYEAENGLAPSYIFSYTADATDQSRKLLSRAGTNEIMAKPPPKGFIARLVSRLESKPSASTRGPA